MSRGYMCTYPSEYICRYCGYVQTFYDKGDGFLKKYTIRNGYCPICMTETDHIRLGSLDRVKAELEFMNVLEGMDFEVYNLITTNDVRKQKKLIK